jgi:ubiquinone/menaquinone biosynthesis C-methylase UbiE
MAPVTKTPFDDERKPAMDKTKKTVTGYNRCAAQFTAAHFDLGVYKQYVREFAALLPTDARILDLGCGPGNIAHYLSRDHPERRLTGVDLSTEMLSLARQNVPQARLIYQDLRDLELEQQFDALIISFCIIHLYERETAALLQKSVNWLVPRGYLYLNFMTGGTAGFAKTSFSENKLYFNYYEAGQLITLLTNIGYQISSQKSRPCPQPGNPNVSEVFIIAQKSKPIDYYE